MFLRTLAVAAMLMVAPAYAQFDPDNRVHLIAMTIAMSPEVCPHLTVPEKVKAASIIAVAEDLAISDEVAEQIISIHAASFIRDYADEPAVMANWCASTAGVITNFMIMLDNLSKQPAP